jgi:hypothetical protein
LALHPDLVFGGRNVVWNDFRTIEWEIQFNTCSEKPVFMAWIFFEVNENVLIPRDRRISGVDFKSQKSRRK